MIECLQYGVVWYGWIGLSPLPATPGRLSRYGVVCLVYGMVWDVVVWYGVASRVIEALWCGIWVVFYQVFDTGCDGLGMILNGMVWCGVVSRVIEV